MFVKDTCIPSLVLQRMKPLLCKHLEDSLSVSASTFVFPFNHRLLTSSYYSRNEDDRDDL